MKRILVSLIVTAFCCAYSFAQTQTDPVVYYLNAPTQIYKVGNIAVASAQSTSNRGDSDHESLRSGSRKIIYRSPELVSVETESSLPELDQNNWQKAELNQQVKISSFTSGSGFQKIGEGQVSKLGEKLLFIKLDTPIPMSEVNGAVLTGSAGEFLGIVNGISVGENPKESIITAIPQERISIFLQAKPGAEASQIVGPSGHAPRQMQTVTFKVKSKKTSGGRKVLRGIFGCWF